MPMEEEPVVGHMYEDPDGQSFEVLSFNEDDGTIGVQYADGTVGEIDIDAWYEMDLEQLATAEPWDATGDEEENPKLKGGAEDEDDDDYEDIDEDEDEQ